MAKAIRQSVMPVYLFACLLLGGSTRAPWPNMALQIGAVAILAWAGLARPRVQGSRHSVYLAVGIAAMLGLIFLQLIPLPPALWSALPGRGVIAHGFDLLGQPRPWLSLSLAPYDTLTSALWLLPPLALIAGILRLGAFREQWMTIVIAIAALIGVFLGVMQLASIDHVASHWYIYPITNEGSAVGFFANANHMAMLLVSTLPFLFAMYGGRRGRQSKESATASAAKIAILGGAMIVLLVGIALNGSLAGIALGTIVLAASAFVRASLDQARARWGILAGGLVVLVAGAALVASPLHNNLTSPGVENDYSSRYNSFRNSLRATGDHFPVGSGVGSFAHVYPSYEEPAWVDRWYVNHVHNDYIELAMETGLPGILLILSFILWWMQRVIAIWRAQHVDHFARAATIASGAILLHSLVDFPLRTTSICALFAYCVALMAGVRRRSTIERPIEDPDQGARHLSIG